MGILRKADRSLSTAEITTEVLSAMGLGNDSKAAVLPRVRANLQHQAYRRKTVVKSGKQREAMWRLA
jgi:hypothetical protein